MVLQNRINTKKNYGIIAFLLGLLAAAVVVVPIMIVDKGYFLYYGDFNTQQIPFYRLAHDAILSGNTGWSHLTDLGANFVGSYSFYLLGSPFFYLTLLLKSEWVAYAIGPLLILKLGCCSLTAYIFLRRYVSDRRFAVIGGLLYAFSGFSVYNIFFFHFHEAMIVFPLLLAAIDEFHYNRRRGVVALCVGAAATVNYYFFFGQVVFCAIYYVIKLVSRSYRFKLKEFVLLSIECIIGVCLSAALLLPSIAAITGNYRLTEFAIGWDGVLYDPVQRYMQILVSLFFPADIPARVNFTPDSSAKWASVAAYIPMFSMTYVIAYLRKKRSVSRRMFIVLAVMAAVPILNSIFQALNSVFYMRWFYMLTLVMALMTVVSLDDIRECDFGHGFRATAIITGVLAVVIGLMPQIKYESDDGNVYGIGLMEEKGRFWGFVAIAVVGLVATYLLYRFFKKDKDRFVRYTCIALCAFCIGYSEIYLFVGKSISEYDDPLLTDKAFTYGKELWMEDIDVVRSDYYMTLENLGMYWNTPTIQAFHSIVPSSVMEFYSKLGATRDVISNPTEKLYGIRSLLSVKYLFDNASKKGFVSSGETAMPGYTYIGTASGYHVYENDCYIPMGFTYDDFMTEPTYLDLSDDIRHLVLLKTMVLSVDQMEKYRDIIGYEDGMQIVVNSQDDYNNDGSPYEYTEQAYYADCGARRAHSCESFEYTNEGFEAVFDNTGGKTNLLFFSVPYEKGWSATVNGEPVDIEIVNTGFMAVKVDADIKSEIEFTYRTPMLTTGIIISAGAWVLLAFYCIIYKGLRGPKTRRKYRVKQNTKAEEQS